MTHKADIWLPHDVYLLRVLAGENISAAEISVWLGKPVDSVCAKAKELGLPLKREVTSEKPADGGCD